MTYKSASTISNNSKDAYFNIGDRIKEIDLVVYDSVNFLTVEATVCILLYI